MRRCPVNLFPRGRDRVILAVWASTEQAHHDPRSFKRRDRPFSSQLFAEGTGRLSLSFLRGSEIHQDLTQGSVFDQTQKYAIPGNPGKGSEGRQ